MQKFSPFDLWKPEYKGSVDLVLLSVSVGRVTRVHSTGHKHELLETKNIVTLEGEGASDM